MVAGECLATPGDGMRILSAAVCANRTRAQLVRFRDDPSASRTGRWTLGRKIKGDACLRQETAGGKSTASHSGAMDCVSLKVWASRRTERNSIRADLEKNVSDGSVPLGGLPARRCKILQSLLRLLLKHVSSHLCSLVLFQYHIRFCLRLFKLFAEAFA